MKICGIISEYNPFHTGHAHQIVQTRTRLGEDTAIVCVMSGNFVQRGEPAVFAKHARAEAAVRGGADLVLELPLPWAISSAEGFARGGVGMLGALGCVTHISFGSECGELERLRAAAEVLLDPRMDELIRAELQSGAPYAAARQRAAERLAGAQLRELSEPNNLLGVEYLKAIAQQDLDITPITVLRTGAAHDAAGDGESHPSAAQLRDALRRGESIRSGIPPEVYAVLARELEQGRGPVGPEALETAILSRLRFLPQEAFAALPGASEGIENLIYRAAQTEPTLDAVCAAAKSRRYALSRLRRMTMCAALGVTAADSAGRPPYLRVLAANCRGTEVLRAASATASVPILTRPADAKTLDARAQRTFALEAASTDLFTLGFTAEDERRGGSDWRTSPVILKPEDLSPAPRHGFFSKCRKK